MFLALCSKVLLVFRMHMQKVFARGNLHYVLVELITGIKASEFWALDTSWISLGAV